MRGLDHKFICLLESIKRPLDAIYTGKFSVTQQQSNSNLAQVCCCKGATLLMQAPGNWVKDLLTFTFWVFSYYHHHQNEPLLQMEFNLLSDSVAFQERWCGHTCACSLACWSDLSECASAQIELWRHQRDGSDSLFHFHAESDIICTDVQRIHWCMALLSRSRLNELISVATKQSALFALTSVPAHSERIMSGYNTDRPPPPSPKSSIILWKSSCFFSGNNKFLLAMSNSQALKETRIRV